MKRILLLSIIACALGAAPLYARPHGNSRSGPVHGQRSTIARVAPGSGHRFATTRNFARPRYFTAPRNFNSSRNFTNMRSVNRVRHLNVVRHGNRAHFGNHHDHHRVVYYGAPWYGYGYGSPYYSSYYPSYYGYGPAVSFNFNNNYPYNYGGGSSYRSDYGSNYYSNDYSNGYSNAPDSGDAQPASPDGSYNVGNASIVSKVQEQLQRDGYYKGDIDGALGSRTHYAIRAYQRDHKLQANGTVTEELLRTMGLR